MLGENQLPHTSKVPRSKAARIWLGALSAAALVVSPFACTPLPTGEDIKEAIDGLGTGGSFSIPGFGGMGGLPIDVDLDVTVILKNLFPDLDTGDIAKIASDLTLDEVIRLRDELEAARKDAEKFSATLLKTSEAVAEERRDVLSKHNSGFPEGLAALGIACNYDGARETAILNLSGVFSGQAAVKLSESNIVVRVDGQEQEGQLSCLAQDETVDIVLLIDITGSMSSVIAAVRDSVVRFVGSIEKSGLRGTLSVVTYQDTVGVNSTFQEPAPSEDLERSPFFKPVSIQAADEIDALRGFVNRLEANRGADAPENLAAALDFARNNVIGGTATSPNRIDGSKDPRGVSPFPALASDRQVFIVLTDVGFHPDPRNEMNSSLLREFDPRPAEAILSTFRKSSSVIHVVDPSWEDTSKDPTSSSESMTDADYWAEATGGLGVDRTEGYSLLDLESVIVSKDSGLLDVYLDQILATSCSYEFSAQLSANAEVEVELSLEGEVFTELVAVEAF